MSYTACFYAYNSFVVVNKRIARYPASCRLYRTDHICNINDSNNITVECDQRTAVFVRRRQHGVNVVLARTRYTYSTISTIPISKLHEIFIYFLISSVRQIMYLPWFVFVLSFLYSDVWQMYRNSPDFGQPFVWRYEVYLFSQKSF